ncbi:MAG TPA: hypothetical protein VMI54_06825 [Polyangiaceae bacterium]|nr:hypothetical protein [Polyangiaceae bacterium]
MKELPPAFRTIPSGGELLEAIDEAFGRHRGWIQATGFVEDVELRFGSDGADLRRTFRGRFALAELSGPLGGPYGATLSRAVGDKIEVLAGVLVRARSGGVQALCISAGDAPSRVLAETEGLVEPAPPAAPGFAKRPLVSAFAAKVGVSGAAPDDAAEEPMPERGDLVEHFAFGICEVLAVTGDRLTLRDLRGQGRTREIALERLSVNGPVEHDGRRLFRLSRR